MRPHFKRFFRSMAQKDLLLSDACLPFCGHSLLFFCRRFLFQIKRKCRNAESVKSLIIVGREGSKPIINNLQLLRPCIGYADIGQPQGLSLRSVKSKISYRLRGNGASRSPHPTSCASINLCRFCGRIIFAPTAHLFTIHFYLLL